MAFLPWLLFPFSGAGAIAHVSVINDSFSPATTNINVGDQVIWTWGGGSVSHNVVSESTSFAWLFPNTGGTTGNQNNSNLKNAPFAFTNTFNSAGSFPYECTEHVGLGMVGTINVAAVNAPPSVTITNPASGMVFIAPANLVLQASATDSDGTVTNVQFLVGSVVLTNIAAAPFSAVTNNVPAGNYTFTAVASDNAGVKSTNTVSISVVTPLPLDLNAPQFSPAGFQFSYAANIGLNYIVLWSTNLAVPNWIPIFTNMAASNPVVFLDNRMTNNPGFYRVGLLPNP